MSFITDTLGSALGVDITHTTDQLSSGAAAGVKPTSNPTPASATGGFTKSPYFMPMAIIAGLLVLFFVIKKV